MKKFLLGIILALALVCSVLGLTACREDDNTKTVPTNVDGTCTVTFDSE